MTEQEKTILQGLYAAGFRYAVRDGKWMLFGTEKFIKILDSEWTPLNPETNRVTDLDTAVDGLFKWIKPDGEQVEIAKIKLFNQLENTDNCANNRPKEATLIKRRFFYWFGIGWTAGICYCTLLTIIADFIKNKV